MCHQPLQSHHQQVNNNDNKQQHKTTTTTTTPTPTTTTLSFQFQFLRYIYITTCALCGFMVFWILIFPSSWLSGRSQFHDDVMIRQFIPEHGITPRDITEKYAGHTAIHVTHTLPGALWAALIPFQFHSTFRKRQPKWHRRLGYMFVVSGILVTIGIGIILQRQLLFSNFFPDLPPNENDILPPEYAIIFLSMYFGMTLLYALYLARSGRKFVMDHQKWMIRHVASGIWIAIQRILLITVYSILYPPPVARRIQRQVFGDAAQIATVLSFCLGEVTVYLLSSTSTSTLSTTSSTTTMALDQATIKIPEKIH